MEASEKIVETYMRAVKHCLTTANIKCPRNKEIDLLAVGPNEDKYHIESSVKTSSEFQELKSKEEFHRKLDKATKRGTIEFFKEEKFEHPYVTQVLNEWGFTEGRYKKIVVVMESSSKAEEKAKNWGIEIWHFPQLLMELFNAVSRTEYLSGVERLLQLILHSLSLLQREEGK